MLVPGMVASLALDSFDKAICLHPARYAANSVTAKLPLLLDHYSNTEKYDQYAPMEFQEQMIRTDPNHNLEPRLWQLLKSKI